MKLLQPQDAEGAGIGGMEELFIFLSISALLFVVSKERFLVLWSQCSFKPVAQRRHRLVGKKTIFRYFFLPLR